MNLISSLTNVIRHLNTVVFIAAISMSAGVLADAQQGDYAMSSGRMMGHSISGWMGEQVGGWGWVIILLIAVVFGLLGWVIAQKTK